MRLFAWLTHNEKKDSQRERAELEEAKLKMQELDKRAERLKRDNHFVANVKKVLGAQ
jgi:hypothetical protein